MPSVSTLLASEEERALPPPAAADDDDVKVRPDLVYTRLRPPGGVCSLGTEGPPRVGPYFVLHESARSAHPLVWAVFCTDVLADCERPPHGPPVSR